MDQSALRTSRARNEIKFLTFGLGSTFPSESEAETMEGLFFDPEFRVHERTLTSDLDERFLQALND